MATYYQIRIQELFTKFIDKKFSVRDLVTYERLRKNYMLMYPDYYLGISKGKRIDYEVKSVIFHHYSYELKCVRKYLYWKYMLENNLTNDFVQSLTDKERLQWQEYVLIGADYEYHHSFVFKEMVKICNADRQRRLRLKNRISNILFNGNAYFVTLTFTDELLANTQPHIRRKYVCELIRSISNDYVGNIDFGKKNGREHYHIVLSTDKFTDLEFRYFKGSGYSCNYSSAIDSWSKNGLYFIKQCGNADSDSTALAKYTTKLTNHAIKETTKRNALIYSR